MAWVEAGKLCPADIPGVMDGLRRWVRDGAWNAGRRRNEGGGSDDRCKGYRVGQAFQRVGRERGAVDASGGAGPSSCWPDAARPAPPQRGALCLVGRGFDSLRAAQLWHGLMQVLRNFQNSRSPRRRFEQTAISVLKFGGAREDRTPDLLNAIQALSHLSYDPTGCRSAMGFALRWRVFRGRCGRGQAKNGPRPAKIFVENLRAPYPLRALCPLRAPRSCARRGWVRLLPRRRPHRPDHRARRCHRHRLPADHRPDPHRR